MKIHAITLLGGIVAVFASGASAQAVNQSNYRNHATCEEVEVNGKWFNSFGEGRCPPGARRSSTETGERSDVNARTIQRTQDSVAAIGAMQQSLLSLGRSIGRRYQAVSDNRAATYAYHLYNDPATVSPADLFSPRKVRFPLSGTVVVAKVDDAVLTERDGFFSECFIPLVGGEAKQIGGHRHTIQPNELTCKLTRDDAAYTPLYNNYSSSLGVMSMGQALKLKGNTYQICYRNMGINSMCIKDIPSNSVIEATGIVEIKNTDNNLAVFKGASYGKISLALKDGSLLNFDLNSSRIVEIYGVSFEVLEFSAKEVVMRRN